VNISREIEKLASLFPKSDVISGSVDEKNVSDRTKGLLEFLGLDAHIYTFRSLSWREEEATIEVGSIKFSACAMPYTPSGDIESEIIYAGYGMFEEEWKNLNVEDKIVLLKWFDLKLDEVVWQYINAVKMGASAVIFFDPFPSRLRRMVLTLNTDYRFGGGTPPYVPAVSVSFEDGLRLVKLARSGSKVRVYTATEVNHDAKSYTVYGGDLEGPVFTAHIDKWLTGFTDNVLGTAIVLMLARSFGEKAGYILFGSEESGAPDYSPWYWIWGSREFVRYLEETNRINNIGPILNFDVLGGTRIHVSVSGPDFERGVMKILSNEVSYGPDETIYDSFSFTLKGIASLTFNTFEEMLPYYHTDRDVSHNVSWEHVERVLRYASEVANAFINKRWGIMDYTALTKVIREKLEYISSLEHAKRVIDLLENIKIEDENTARQLRQSLTAPLYHGRYETTFNDILVIYPYLLDPIDDLLILEKALQGKANPLEIKGYRIISGYETIFPSIETIFGKKAIPRNILKEAYTSLRGIVEKNLMLLEERLREIKQ